MISYKMQMDLMVERHAKELAELQVALNVATVALEACVQMAQAAVDAALYPRDPPGYAARVRALEAQGLTTSDAQGCADAEFAKAVQS